MLSYAEEDPLEDEAEVEGESDMEEVGVTDDEEEETKTTASPDADTTILFVKPVSTGASLGICIAYVILYSVVKLRVKLSKFCLHKNVYLLNISMKLINDVILYM